MAYWMSLRDDDSQATPVHHLNLPTYLKFQIVNKLASGMAKRSEAMGRSTVSKATKKQSALRH